MPFILDIARRNWTHAAPAIDEEGLRVLDSLKVLRLVGSDSVSAGAIKVLSVSKVVWW